MFTTSTLFKKIIFLHIPKTGGTSLHQMLLPYFDKDQIFPERYNNIKQFSKNDLFHYRFFSGHFDRANVDWIPGSKQIISMLREPRDRIISLYKFWKAHRWQHIHDHGLNDLYHVKKLTFKNYIKKEQFNIHKAIDNVQTRIFLGEIGDLKDNRSFICPIDEVFDRAKTYLDDLTAYGIVEYFDQTVPDIFSALGFSKPKKCLKMRTLDAVCRLPHTENIIPDDFHIDKEDEENLERLTWADKLLYNYAKTKLGLMF